MGKDAAIRKDNAVYFYVNPVLHKTSKNFSQEPAPGSSLKSVQRQSQMYLSNMSSQTYHKNPCNIGFYKKDKK